MTHENPSHLLEPRAEVRADGGGLEKRPVSDSAREPERAVRATPGVEPGREYGVIDPDYARIFTVARLLAWQEGYALAMHGSFTRDLDLLAVPWTDKASEPGHLVRRILAACENLREQHGNPGEKPHGRRVWTLVFSAFGDPRFVDLSIMPRSP